MHRLETACTGLQAPRTGNCAGRETKKSERGRGAAGGRERREEERTIEERAEGRLRPDRGQQTRAALGRLYRLVAPTALLKTFRAVSLGPQFQALCVAPKSCARARSKATGRVRARRLIRRAFGFLASCLFCSALLCSPPISSHLLFPCAALFYNHTVGTREDRGQERKRKGRKILVASHLHHAAPSSAAASAAAACASTASFPLSFFTLATVVSASMRGVTPSGKTKSLHFLLSRTSAPATSSSR